MPDPTTPAPTVTSTLEELTNGVLALRDQLAALSARIDDLDHRSTNQSQDIGTLQTSMAQAGTKIITLEQNAGSGGGGADAASLNDINRRLTLAGFGPGTQASPTTTPDT